MSAHVCCVSSSVLFNLTLFFFSGLNVTFVLDAEIPVLQDKESTLSPISKKMELALGLIIYDGVQDEILEPGTG